MMTSNSNSSTVRDGSFCCLIAIYAAHLLLFHLFQEPSSYINAKIGGVLSKNGTADAASQAYRQVYVSYGGEEEDVSLRFNATDDEDESHTRKEFELGGSMRYQTFSRDHQQQHTNWESSSSTLTIDRPTLPGYPKLSLDLYYLVTSSISRVRGIFSSVALSPSSWGIISGCAIFLLTYNSDRDNNVTLQHHVKLLSD